MSGMSMGLDLGLTTIHGDPIDALLSGLVSARLQPHDYGEWTPTGAPTIVSSNGIPAIRMAETDTFAASITLASLTSMTAFIAVASIANGEGASLLQEGSPTAFAGKFVDSSANSPFSNAGTPSMTVDGVAKTTRDEVHDAIADSSKHLIEITEIDASAWAALTISGGTLNNALAGDIAEVIVVQGASAAQVALLRAHMNGVLKL